MIYFGSPLNFNDPYDCALKPRIKPPTDADIERRRHHYVEGAKFPDSARQHFKALSAVELRESVIRNGGEVIQERIEIFLKNNGVSCFSEVKGNLLLWSHYGENCKGFCLEFRTDMAPFEKLHKVKYTDEMPQIDLIAMLCEEDNDEVINLYRTKASDWKYEHEWRCIHDRVGTRFCYASGALTGIYLGPEMPFTHLEIIALVLAGQNPTVQLWQGSRSETSFKVEFAPVSYTSFIEAKRCGLR